jgi:hypothetical protein
MKASERQEGGSHYKSMAIQPGEFIRKNGLGWYEGNALKYICRYKQKGGIQDIKKAIHYLELILEETEDVSGSNPDLPVKRSPSLPTDARYPTNYVGIV